ncbi:MAG: MBL fold metallo-hydrolase [Pseudomonadota bacterium]
MHITFAGCGDAFGSGRRFNTCFHIRTTETCFLIDCGASSMIALKAQGLDPNEIDTIIITHFHGDHFGGLPYFMLDAQFFSKRTAPLAIAGPAGLREAFIQVMETAFTGSSRTRPRFDLTFAELVPGQTQALGPLTITTARVRHGPPDGPFHAYRITTAGKTIAYTGDTEWVEALVAIGREADLMIAEAYTFDKRVPLHLDLATLAAHLPRIAPRRLILTHMSDDMLARLPDLPHETAHDGLKITI